jgi:MFS family permease
MFRQPICNSRQHPLKWGVGSLHYSLGGLVALFGWLLWGDFAYSLRDRVVPAVMQLLFKKFGASDTLTGLLFSSLPCLLTVVIGPIVGYQSDRLRTRWGRRIPFLFFSMPLIVSAVAGLALCAPLGQMVHVWLGARSPGVSLCMLGVAAASWTIFEVGCVVAGGVFAALINDVVPQAVVGRCFGVLRAGGLLISIVFNLLFFGNSENSYPWLFAAVGIVYAVGFTLMCGMIKEGKYPPPRSDGGTAWKAVRTYFRDGFGNPYYLTYFAASIMASQTVVPFNVYSVFFSQSLHISRTTYGECLAATYVISFVLSYPLGWLADRYHPLRVTIFGQAVYAAVMLYGYLFVQDTGTFILALIAHGVASGSLWTIGSSISQRLLPRAKFAEIGSAGGILQNIAGIATAPAIGWMLDRTHGEYRLTFLAGFVLTLLSIAAFLVLYRKFVALGGPNRYVAPE